MVKVTGPGQRPGGVCVLWRFFVYYCLVSKTQGNRTCIKCKLATKRKYKHAKYLQIAIIPDVMTQINLVLSIVNLGLLHLHVWSSCIIDYCKNHFVRVACIDYSANMFDKKRKKPTVVKHIFIVELTLGNKQIFFKYLHVFTPPRFRDREAGLHIERYDFRLNLWTHGFEAIRESWDYRQSVC